MGPRLWGPPARGSAHTPTALPKHKRVLTIRPSESLDARLTFGNERWFVGVAAFSDLTVMLPVILATEIPTSRAGRLELVFWRILVLAHSAVSPSSPLYIG